MTLSAGTKLGPYEVLAPIGAGGMGEVYKARDTRLGRSVAVKVLPAHLAANPEFRQRFEREAKIISSLNHPHICALYDVGQQNGIDYLIMEYLEGETLAQRLAPGPLPPEQVVRYGMQIADALDKAHRRSLTHRDLKPGNIMLTAAGAKLLDFGLAKTAATSSPAELSTPTQSLSLTAAGNIVGTVQYMSPEQLQGKDADARSDIFALGAVLYEMLTARKAFEGVTQATVLGAILHADPPPVAHGALNRVIRRCLAKDPEERWQSARDVMLELREPASVVQAPIAAPARRAPKLAWALAAACFLVAVVLAVLHFRPAAPMQVMRFTVSAPPNGAFNSAPVISPDGTHLAFSGLAPATFLWVRPLDSLASRSLAGTEGGRVLFWSPDSRSVGFFATGKLKRIDISGGPPQVLADASPYGGTWSRDGVIVFTPTARSGLRRVSAVGGPATPVTTLDASRGEVSHRWPYFLPDGRHFLYLATANAAEGTGVYIASLEGGTKAAKRLFGGTAAAIYAPLPGGNGRRGHLLALEQNTLQARPFDASRLEVTGLPFPVAELSGAAGFDIWNFDAYSASRTGLLVYLPDMGLASTKLAWFDREGKLLGNAAQAFRLSHPALSPDEKRVAFEIPDPRSGQWDLWVTDLTRNVNSRFTFETSNESGPVWSADGSQLFFMANRNGAYRLFRKLASGAGGEEQVLESTNWILPTGVLSDRFLVYHELDPSTKWDLWILPLTGDRKPMVFLKGPFEELNGQFSPDGRWLAYNSNETGGTEVYIQSFPPSGAKWQISTGGGSHPRWRRDGKELYYLAGDQKIMAVEIRGATTLEPGQPRPLFQARGSGLLLTNLIFPYTVSGDGKRFLINSNIEEGSQSPVVVVVNWIAALKR